jgi:hypothetical protein
VSVCRDHFSSGLGAEGGCWGAASWQLPEGGPSLRAVTDSST